jgi:hypothetical protein
MTTTNDTSKLKIIAPMNSISNEMCLDFTAPVSPASNASVSPIIKSENNFINIPSKIPTYKAIELTEFDICGEYFQNVIVDEYEMKLRKLSPKSNEKK